MVMVMLTPCKLVDQLVLVELGRQLPVALHQSWPYQVLFPRGCPQESFEEPQLAKATLPFSNSVCTGVSLCALVPSSPTCDTIAELNLYCSGSTVRHSQDPIGIRGGILPAQEEGLEHSVSWFQPPLALILEERSNTIITG